MRSLIRSGAKGVVIEDQVWPKRPGHMYNLEVTGMDEFAAKVAAVWRQPYRIHAHTCRSPSS